MTEAAELADAGNLQRRLCLENGSETYGRIIEAIVDRLDDTGEPVISLLRQDGRPAIGSAVYLRLLGAVHRQVLSDQGAALRRCFPSAGGRADPSEAIPLFFAFVARNQSTIAEEMEVNVQTNEVGRSAVLSAGLRYLSRIVQLPLRLLEVGASAGLNLWPDLYFVNAGRSHWGPARSSVKLTGMFNEGFPAGEPFTVLSRRGCDTAPLDARTDRGRSCLRSFIWPENLDRMARLDNALSMFPGADLDSEDAVRWVARQLAKPSPLSAATVVFHSIVMPYLSTEQGEELGTVIQTAGAAATEDRPLAWLRLEPTGTYDVVAVSVDIWPQDQHLTLATCSPHGSEVVWRPAHGTTPFG